jgi:hypothetical protein
MRYADVKVGETFFFEDGWEYPKIKTKDGHFDIQNRVFGFMPDDVPVVVPSELASLREERDALRLVADAARTGQGLDDALDALDALKGEK